MYIDNCFTSLNPKRFNKRHDAYQICTKLDDMDINYYIDDGVEDIQELSIRQRNENKDFYRHYELFDEDIDEENPEDEEYNQYDNNDIIPERSYAFALMEGEPQPIYHFIDTDFPTIHLLKNNKSVSEEKLIETISKLSNETIKEMLMYEEDLNTIGNLFYSSFLNKDFNNKYLNESLLKDAYEMIKEHYPLDFVIENMKKATQNNNGLGEIYLNNSLKYLTKFPNYSDIYITKYPNTNVQFFDQSAATLVEKLCNICDDEKTIKTIINVTKIRTSNANEIKITDKKLADIAIKLAKINNGKWTDTETKILKLLKREDNMSLQETVHRNSYKTVLALLKLNITTDEILKVLQSIK